MELITGYKGQAHVTAAQTGATNAGIFGNGQFILNVGDLMEATKTDNNHVAIAEGYAINQGRYFCTTGESVTIETGTASNKREDLIVARYEKAASGVESVTLKVIKGTAGADYTTPDYVTGDILDGDTVDEMPLYKVHLIGAELEEIVRVAEIKESFGGGINLITNAEYEALSEEEQNARDYLITDLDAEPIDASVIEYDDDVSVKTALDTLNNSLSTLETKVAKKTEILFSGTISQTKTIELSHANYRYLTYLCILGTNMYIVRSLNGANALTVVTVLNNDSAATLVASGQNVIASCPSYMDFVVLKLF